jgi:hypothetical protein
MAMKINMQEGIKYLTFYHIKFLLDTISTIHILYKVFTHAHMHTHIHTRTRARVRTHLKHLNHRLNECVIQFPGNTIKFLGIPCLKKSHTIH